MSIKEAFDAAYEFLNPVLQRGTQTTQQVQAIFGISMLTNERGNSEISREIPPGNFEPACTC